MKIEKFIKSTSSSECNFEMISPLHEYQKRQVFDKNIYKIYPPKSLLSPE